VYSTQSILYNFFAGIVGYIPQLLAGLILLAIGIIVSNLTKNLILGLLRLLNRAQWVRNSRVGKSKTLDFWYDMTAELVRWSIMILFLVAAVESWGLTQVGALLSQLLIYLPNVFIAAVIGFIGMIAAAIVRDLVKHSAKGLGSQSAGALSTVASYAVIIFTALLVLNQLGIGADLVKILFTAVVSMIALAGGLAFGLGGQDVAKDLLNELYRKLKG